MSGSCEDSTEMEPEVPVREYQMRRLLTIIIRPNPGEIIDTLQPSLHFPSRLKVTVNDLIKARKVTDDRSPLIYSCKDTGGYMSICNWGNQGYKNIVLFYHQKQ